MKLSRNLSKLQLGIFVLLVCCTGVLGYLFYDTHRANIQNLELIADTKIENKDLSQDIDIMKDKHAMLQKEVELLKSKIKKVSYRKNIHKKKRLYSAGKSSKNKHYKRQRVSYKKLYYDLKRQCSNKSYSKKSAYKKNNYTYKNKSYKTGNYSSYSYGKYKRR